ncbi:alanine/glycine:cation symporter family protein [Microaceticoccus formicicus]|uniref:alanine/glycine:cation symporter family protein n=1 Tax=Microaceticoccus formicicus TaxID=3118105 RepID=UPI003CD000D7|nr:amino acid carrier protein [Peptoniphilaceae bacterium AMB_02]
MDFFVKLANWLWGPPILILIVGGGLIISLRTGFFQIRYLPFILKETFGKMFSKETEGEGTVSAFQAMTTALASSIGAANIVVVPTIIFAAGPGAVFWMWVAAIVGQATKFGEVALGIKYRKTNKDGDFVGGACYYLKEGIGGNLGKIIGAFTAFFFMIEIFPSITLQTLSAAGAIEMMGSSFGMANTGLIKTIAIIAIFILTSLVVHGGVKAIGEVTEKLVPFMAVIYLVFGAIILAMNFSAIPGAFKMIIVGAFNPKAVVGGVGGATLKAIIQNGIARGVYSNEAGMGSAPYGHAAATTDHPARQGLWGCFEVIVDTLIVCTVSALLVLTTGVWNPEMSAAEMKAVSPVAIERVFNSSFGSIGSLVLSVCLFLFVMSTIIVIAFYTDKLGEYLFGTKAGNIIRWLSTFMIILAIFLSFDNAGTFLDITLGLVVIPNMIGLVMMSGQIKDLKNDFFNNPEFYPGAKKSKLKGAPSKN